MHIAIFVDFHDQTVGGVQTSVRGQRKGLEQLGHKVTIFSPPPVGPIPNDPATVIIPALPFVRPNGFPMVAPSKHNAWLIEEKLDRIDPVDIIHVQTNMGVGILGSRIAKKRSIPLVQTMHGRDDVFARDTYPFPPVTTMLLRLLHRHYIPHASTVHKLHDTVTAHNAWQVMVNVAQFADHVVVPSHHFAEKFRQHGVTRPTEVISNGISDDVVAKLPHKLRKVTDTIIPLRVLWCGRLSPEKRPLDSIKAVSQIEGCTLDLYGNGPLTKKAQEYIDSHGLSDRIRLKGRVNQDEILAAMQAHDVLLYPSYGFDNQPMVLLEAVAAGTPIIYCDPDLTECMPEEGGILTESASVESLTAALLQLQTNPAKRQKMLKAMYDYRDKIVQSYHSKKMVALYKQLVRR